MLQAVKASLNGLITHHILIPPYHGTSFMVRFKLDTLKRLMLLFLFLFFIFTDLCNPFLSGSGVISQDTVISSSYYVSVGNLNSEDVEVNL